MGTGVGTKYNFSLTSPIFNFFYHFISTFSIKNDNKKFQLLKLCIKKVRSRLLCSIQYKQDWPHHNDGINRTNAKQYEAAGWKVSRKGIHKTQLPTNPHEGQA